MTSSRRKGKRGELEIATLLRDLLGTPSVAQAGKAKTALFYRVDRGRWGVVIALADVVPGFEAEARELKHDVGRRADNPGNRLQDFLAAVAAQAGRAAEHNGRRVDG